MRQTVLFALFLCGVTGYAAGSGATLDTLLRHAHRESPAIEVIEARLDAAEAAVLGAQVGSWPRISLGATYLQTDEPMTAFGTILNQGVFDNTIDFNQPGQSDALSTRLEAHYALYTGGRRTAMRAEAEAGRSMAKADGDNRLLALEAALTEAYFHQRHAEAHQQTLAAACTALEESLRVAELREAAGQLHASERLNLTATLAERRQQLLEARERVSSSGRSIALLLGQSEAPKLAAEDPFVANLQVVSTEAGSHPQLRAAEAQIAQAKAREAGSVSGRRPSVEAFARVQYDRGWRRDGEGHSWLAGIAAEVPLFDGFQTRSAISAALAQRREAEAAAETARLQVAKSRADAAAAHALAIEAAAVAELRLEASERSAQLLRERFAAGAASSDDLLAAEARYTAAQMAQETAHLQERATLAAQQLAAGQSLLPPFAQ